MFVFQEYWRAETGAFGIVREVGMKTVGVVLLVLPFES